MSKRQHGLSKSRITAFEQCEKRLWLTVHRPELAEEDADAQTRFSIGHSVGDAACAMHPDGVMVAAEPDLAAALDMTARLMADGVSGPIFEATLEHDGVLVRFDLLWSDGRSGWCAAEVKSSTSRKDYHLGDLATQIWVAQQNGLKISSAAIRHIDSSFVLRREGDLFGLFADAESLNDVAPLIATRAAVVAAARQTLEGAEPERAPSDHCQSPFPCEFEAYCRRHEPPGPEWPVTVLPQGGGKKWLERGVTDLMDVDAAALNPTHLRVYEATRSGELFHDAEGARETIDGWGWPRIYLDFETIAFAIPRWVGTRPYMQVPFQFSVHVEQSNGEVGHSEFLSLDGSDPRRACAEALVSQIPDAGPVITYNASFERSRIVELAAAFPDLEPQLTAIAERIVDLLPVTRKHWYHRDQRGSWSIKKVLPTLGAELGYDGLEVADGGQAQAAYLEAISGADEARVGVLRNGLLAYCKLDTEAMIVLAHRLCGTERLR